MSRPRRHSIRPSQAAPKASNSSALPTVSGSTLKYSRNVRGFALRIGATSPATPFFMPTTTVSCWPASSARVAANSPWPAVDDSRHVSREPVSPWKQCVQRSPAGRGGHGGARLLDGHRPLVSGDVPVQLVVVGKSIQRPLHRVGDDVTLPPAQCLVGIADLDLLVHAVVEDLVTPGATGGVRHRIDGQIVSAVVALIPLVKHRNVAEDSMVLL